MTHMQQPVQDIIKTVSNWDSVQSTPHRFGGTEFQIESVEMEHIHHFGLIDIPFTRLIRTRLVEEGRALPHHVLPDSGWISFRMRSASDKEQGLWLLRLAYVHTLLNSLRRQRAEHAHLPGHEQISAILVDLDMSEQLRGLLSNRLARYAARQPDTP